MFDPPNVWNFDGAAPENAGEVVRPLLRVSALPFGKCKPQALKLSVLHFASTVRERINAPPKLVARIK